MIGGYFEYRNNNLFWIAEFKVIHYYKTTITASEIIDSGRFCNDEKQEIKHGS